MSSTACSADSRESRSSDGTIAMRRWSSIHADTRRLSSRTSFPCFARRKFRGWGRPRGHSLGAHRRQRCALVRSRHTAVAAAHVPSSLNRVVQTKLRRCKAGLRVKAKAD